MPGPLMHQASMEQCRNLLGQMGLPLVVGSKVEVMEPDLGDSHGYDFKTGRGGSIIDKMEQRYNNIIALFKECKSDIARLNRTAFSREVRFLCHYTTDAHTIGQISSEFWGKTDNKIDGFCEFVTSKKSNVVSLKVYPSKDAIRGEIVKTMRWVYDKYNRKAKKWYFIFSGDMRSMARNAVAKGAEWAASWVSRAKEDA